MTRDFPAGNYRFIPAVFQYSSGAAANPGYEIERVRFDKLAAAGRGICADRKIHPGRGQAADVVLRLRAALAGGVHRRGISRISTSTTSRRWRNGACSTARPIRWRAAMSARRSIRRPSRRSMPSRSRARARVRRRAFVIAGSGEVAGGHGSYAERTVRYRDLSPDGLKEKVRFVVGAMESRMGEFGFGWKDATAVQAYTVHDFHPRLRR